MNVPIENGGAEGTGRAGTTKEQVPDLVSELLGLGVGCEGIVGAVTTEGEGDDLALGLAVLDALSKSLAVQEGRAGKGGATAGLNKIWIREVMSKKQEKGVRWQD